MIGDPVPGAGRQATPSNLGPPERAKPMHSSSWSSLRTLTQKLPDRAMRGQLVEVRAGATATYGGSIERETKLWQVKPTGSPSSTPDTIVTPVANRPRASLNCRESKEGVALVPLPAVTASSVRRSRPPWPH